MSLLMRATVSFAIPARPGIWKSITLSNGKVVRVQLMGDEFNKFYKSDDGQLYVPSGNTYEQISAEALSLKATAKRQAMNEMHAKRRSRLARSGKSGYFGNKRCLIILVQFRTAVNDGTDYLASTIVTECIAVTRSWTRQSVISIANSVRMRSARVRDG